MRITIKDKDIFINMFNQLYTKINIDKINGVTIDSRKIKKNDIFIPIEGQNFNGHNFINEAYSKSAACFSEEKNTKKKIIKCDSTLNQIYKMSSKWKNLSKAKTIAITGSNGKTTTKDLLFHIIKEQYNCSKSDENYNSTIGLPLSFLSSMINDDFSILELGANKPNEIKFLCNIVKPELSLITNISNAHIENFKSINELIQNKFEVYNALPENGIAFVNLDCKNIDITRIKAKKITFSFNRDADFKGKMPNKKDCNSIIINNYKIIIPKKLNHLPELILSTYTICNYLGISNQKYQKYLNTFCLPNGRGEKLYYKNTTIINDTYNSNPSSIKLGISRFNNINKAKHARKIIIIGDMLELGSDSINEHIKVGKLINKADIDIVITFGEFSINSHHEIKKTTQKKHFHKHDELKKYFNSIIHEGDQIYIKGSRSMQLERIFKS